MTPPEPDPTAEARKKTLERRFDSLADRYRQQKNRIASVLIFLWSLSWLAPYADDGLWWSPVAAFGVCMIVMLILGRVWGNKMRRSLERWDAELTGQNKTGAGPRRG